MKIWVWAKLRSSVQAQSSAGWALQALWASAAGGQKSVIPGAAPGKTGLAVLAVQGLICAMYRGHPSVSEPDQPSHVHRACLGDYSIFFFFIDSIVKMVINHL